MRWRNLLKLAVAALAVLGAMVLLGLLLKHSGPVGRVDERLERTLADSRTSLGDTLTDAATRLADPVDVEVALGVLVVGLAVGTRRLAPPLFLLLAVGVESVVYFYASTWVARDRPHVARMGPADPHASYPSGHAAAAVCLYGGLAVLAWRLTSRRWLQVGLTTLAAVVPLLVGYARMYRGFHHLTDVLAGLLLGAVWLALCTRWVLAEEPAR